jgi:hypothetical protein
MNRISIPSILLLIALSAISTRADNPAQAERLNAASLLALGRLPTGEEMAQMNQRPAAALPDLVASQQALLSSNADEKQAMIVRAFQDSFGRNPTETELRSLAAKPATYAARMAESVVWLSTQSADYRLVIERAYQLTLARPPYAEEYTYWTTRSPLPFVLLVGAIENWAQRNAPGLMVTSGAPTVSINSRFLRTYRLSPGVANEVRVILGLPVWSDVGRLQNPGCNLVAPGAEGISSLGGIHCMVVGRPEYSGS